jgi:hypothetical protein
MQPVAWLVVGIIVLVGSAAVALRRPFVRGGARLDRHGLDALGDLFRPEGP